MQGLNIYLRMFRHADPNGHAVYNLRLPPLTCWECGFESPRDTDVCREFCVLCQVEVSALGRSLVQRSPTECGVSIECDREAP